MRKTTMMRRLIAIGVGLAFSTTAFAEKYDVGVRNSGSTATPVQQEAPSYPADLADSGQEGWVRMHFVVAPDGRAIDPIIIDSSGGAGFETEARKALEKDLVHRAMARNRGNLTRTAMELGISRPSLYNLMDKLGIERN